MRLSYPKTLSVWDSFYVRSSWVDARFVFNSLFVNRHLFRMQVYHLFGWFWVMNFIIALGQCVLAGAFASYYWAWDKKTVSAGSGFLPKDFNNFDEVL